MANVNYFKDHGVKEDIQLSIEDLNKQIMSKTSCMVYPTNGYK